MSTRAGRRLEPFTIIGSGLDPAPTQDADRILRKSGVPADYVLYLGRVDRNKGCDTLLEYFQPCASNTDAPTLVLAGPSKMRIPEHPKIRALGYVSDALREALLARARVLIVPSPYESLSIVLLEGWNHGVPALVNGRCRVLDGQVRRANGGLSFRSAAEFEVSLRYLLASNDLVLAEGLREMNAVDLVTRQIGLPALHSMSDLVGRRYLVLEFKFHAK